ncbi:NRDE family protein [Komagataeibacter oboediens]|uniref:NRDE family protein n=1 Tax=Komagataeibacter oboediens TaxID=65958 RepID=UPI001C2BEEC7|nr:NRDE family protein [Komagataeibacter oboediens]MBV0887923.1 NRDE family protein [Komagataeibacter oboediens]MCK9818729.1 NRDE family protein [Komagataeibacter oboediens]
MCTVVISHDPTRDWPLLLAANRDERLDRPWLPPGRHWADQPDVVGGQDQVAGGSWLTLNDAGVVAGIMNRVGSLGPMPGKNSRGALPLLAGRFPTARDAVAHIATIDAGAWRSFNMIVADGDDAFFIRGPGYGQPQVEPLRPGVHMVATTDPDDMAMPRIARHLPRFRAAARPVPPQWTGWTTLLADRSLPAGSELNIPPRSGFGTCSSSAIGVARDGRRSWFFAAGAPDRVGYQPINLSAPGTGAG